MKKNVLIIFFLSILCCLFGIDAQAQNTYDWTGATSNQWTTASNWQIAGVTAGSYPGQLSTMDVVNLGVTVSYYHLGVGGVTTNPTLAAGNTITVSAIYFGDNLWPYTANQTLQPGINGSTGYEVNLRVQGTLTVTNAITQNYSTTGATNSAELVNDGTTAPYTYGIFNQITGSGTINCASITIGNGAVPAYNYSIGVAKFKVGTGSANLIINAGNIIVNSAILGDGTAANNILSESYGEFSQAGGTINVTNQIQLMENISAYTVPYTQYNPLAFFSLDLYNTNDSPTLNLFGATPVSIQTGPATGNSGTNRNNCDFYNVDAAGGTGTVTVNFANTGASQDVPAVKTGTTLYNYIDRYYTLNATISTTGAITGGSGYVSGYYPNVPLTTTSGTGKGALANITVTGGVVTAITLVSGYGGNYTTSSVLSASNTSLGGSGSGFSLPVTAVAASSTFNGVYQNITFSGSGTKSVTPTAGALLYVKGNFTLAAGSETVDISTNNPAVTIGGNFSSASGTTLNNNVAGQTHDLTIAGTTTNGGIFNEGTTANLILASTFTNTATGTFNLSGSGTTKSVTASLTTSNSGTINQSSSEPLIFSGALTNTSTGIINQSGSGTITSSSTTNNAGNYNQSGTGGTTFTGALTNSGTITPSGGGAIVSSNTTNNSGNYNQTGSGPTTFTGALTNTGTITQSGSGNVTSSNTTSNGGTYNQSGTGLATFTGAVTNTGTINQTNTGNILFSTTFNNSGSASIFSQTGGGTSTFTGAATNDGKITQGSTGSLLFNNTFANTLSGSLFTMTSGTSTFINSYSNSGTFTQTGGTVNFNQPTSQTLTDNSTGGTTFSNVFMKNGGTITMTGSAPGQFHISDVGLLNMTNSTTLGANGFLTINSDAGGSGTVVAIPAGCVINGNVTVQRYLNANRAYRFISSPVYTGNDGTNNYYGVNYLETNTYLTGTGGTGGGFDKAGNPTLYLWRENIIPQYTTFLNSNFIGIADITNPAAYLMNDATYPTANIPIGNGYLFYFRGSRKQASLATLTTAGAAATTDTLNAVGTLIQGSVTVHDWYTPGSPNLGWTTTDPVANVQGFNLVGNPYASAIDWNLYGTAAITETNVAPFSYQLIPTGVQGAGNYGVYQANTPGNTGTNGSTNLIASGEGFLVQATAAGASLTFTEAAKTNSQPAGAALFMAKKIPALAIDQSLRLHLALDTINSDEMIIRFNDNTKTTYNVAEDAAYRSGTGKVNLSSLSSDNIALAINQLPLALKGDTIKLKVNGSVSGKYTFNLKSVTGIPQIYDIWLKDAFAKDSVNLRDSATYSFTINTADTTTFGSNRFKLVLVQDPALAYKLLSFDAQKTDKREVQLTWKTQNEENYTHFTVQRSNDNGKTYEVIGGQMSTGAGSYSLLDKDPLKGNNLYRLQQVDFNNVTTYSDVVTVQFQDNGNGKGGRLACFPNPAISSISLTIVPKSQDATSYNIRVTNSAGMVVRYATVSDVNWQDNVSNLLTGTYLIQVTDAKDHSTVGQTKFVKL